MTFDHEAGYLTARIKVVVNQQESTGTGFLFSCPLGAPDNLALLLVSNKHVFLDPAGTLSVTMNRKTADNKPLFGNTKTFVANGFSSIYIPHPSPNVDLACAIVTPLAQEAFYRCLNEQFLRPIDYSQIAPGTPVTFVGYPDGRYDTVNNLPLTRGGIIASAPDIDYNGLSQIVVDAQVFPGSSGSPVFVGINGRSNLLGVISETMVRHNKLQTITVGESFVVRELLGLGIVIKQSRVKELIDHAKAVLIQRL